MSILVDKNSKVIVQGITGAEGNFHARECLRFGTQLVGGVTPGKGGQQTLIEENGGVPVFDTVLEARQVTAAEVSLIFVPPPFAAEAILEAAYAGLEVIVAITEGIPVKDMVSVMAQLRRSSARLIGPNCPGLLTPGEAKVGIMPGFIAKPGPVGVISKSGTLTYEAAHQISQAGYGVTTCVGIGGDPLVGSRMDEILALFAADPQTEAVVLIGEIGGTMELEAAQYLKEHFKKPVCGFIAGETAPPGRRMGHAGAVIAGAEESAAAKKQALREAGVLVVDSPAEIGVGVKQLLS